ncbi:MAG TPA: alpha/beta fold hydrolase [Longimicrobiales bacterium]|nr:alpha/beta fold hydrolase [Longimicrobiales bacterium]
MATHSEDLLGLMDALGIRRAVLVGRAPATQDLTWIAEHHPERVAGLVYLGNPVVIQSSQHPEARLFDENYARGSCDLEERGIALVGARTSWRPHFLDDETVRIDVPALRFTHPVSHRRSMDLQRLDRLDATAAEEPGCPGHARSLEYFRALAADPARRAALREALEASDLSVPIDEGIERAFGASMRTVVEPDPWEGGLPAFHDFIEPHMRSFLEEVEQAPSDTVHVAPPTGDKDSDRANVQTAFDAVQPGGTVLFSPGTYLLGAGARLTVPDVNVLSHPEGTVLRGCDPEAFSRDESEVVQIVFGCTGLYVQAERQTIRGLTFEYTWHGIVVGPYPTTVEEATALGESGEPLPLYPAGGQRIEGNTFQATPNGLRVLGTGEELSVVRDNDFIDVFHAIGIYGAPLHFLDNRVTVAEPGGVPFSRHPGSAVIVSPGHTDCAGHVVAGNRIEGYPDPIYVLVRRGETCHGVEIRDNAIHAARVKVPEAWGGYTPTDDDSTMVGAPITLMNRTEPTPGPPETDTEGILEDILVEGNHIAGAEGLGILVQGVSRSRIAGNTIAGIQRRTPFPGITWDGVEQRWEGANGSAIWISPGSDGNEIVGNDFEDIAAFAVVVKGDGNRVELTDLADKVRDLGTGNRVSGPDTTTPSPAYESRLVDAGGVRLHYLDFGGAGLPIIFVHSPAWDAHTWEAFAPRFADRNRVLAVTRRGYGKSEGHGGGYDVPTQAESLVAFLDALGIERAVFAGNSGPTAELTYLAEHHPERVAGLIYLAGLAPLWLDDVRRSDPSGAEEMAFRAIYSDPADRDRLRLLFAYRPEFLKRDRPPIALPALAFVARSGTRGGERWVSALSLVGSPLLGELYREMPPSPWRDHLERLVAEEAYRLQELGQIADPAARAYLLRLAGDEALQAAVYRHHQEVIRPALLAGQEEFRRAFGDDLRLVRLHVPQVEGYEYRDAPELIEPHVRRFLEEVSQTAKVRGGPGPAEGSGSGVSTPRGSGGSQVFDLGVRVAVEPMMAPVPVLPAEGDRHLFYELRLTGFDPRTLELDSLHVLDGGTPPNVLAAYDATELRGMVEAPGRGRDLLRILPGTQSVLFLWLVLDSAAPVPAHLRHRLTLSHGQGAGRETLRFDADPVPVSPDPPIVISPPLRGGPWLAHAGPANLSHHRRTLAPRDGTLTMDQRFSSDWLLLKADSTGPGPVSYTGPDWESTFGSEVIAVAEGRVVAVMEGIPDDPIGPLRPGEVINWETIGGNRITVDLGGGRFAWYHHLQTGSLRVQPGEMVRRGEILGLVGNSGNSAAPHLHLEITDSETLGKGRGLPFVFECFDLLARIEPMPGWGALVRAGSDEEGSWDPPLRPQPADDRRRRHEIPLGGVVVHFPDQFTGGDGCRGDER